MTGFTEHIQKALKDGTKKGLAEWLMAVQSTAAALAPIRDGMLRSSATITEPSATTGGVEGAVSFPMVYAAVQHEREDFNHPKGGQAKYLATAVEQNLKTLGATIAQNVEGKA